jgi:flagella basal body P-ring formation protein FlgA
MVMSLVLALGLVSSDTVAAAIERAVVSRMGDVHVIVRQTSTTVGDRPGLEAHIEPGSKLGQPIRFVLTADGKRVGSVVARIEVTGDVPRARRSMARDQEITTDNVEVVKAEIKNALLRRMPEAGDIVGARARRDIVAGELLTNALVSVPPAVKSGDEVRVMLTIGAVSVTGVGRASGSGHVGDTIRVLTPSSRKSLSGRIVGRGAVEIYR